MSTTSSSSRSARGWAPASFSAASSTAGTTVLRARSTSRSSAWRRTSIPCAGAVSAFAARLAAVADRPTELTPPFDARDIFAAARAGDALAAEVVDEVARRIALHVVPVAAVTDVSLVVLGGGLGANGDLLLDPVRARLEGWIPYPPRVEVSALGEAAVLTGALASGLRRALDDVVERRAA